MDIILIGRIAEAGTLQIIAERQQEIKERYSERYLKEGIASLEAEFVAPENLAELESCCSNCIPVGNRGVMQALWDLGCRLECGLRIRLEDIPISQFCIEMADFFDYNPYRADSCGCMLLLSQEAGALLQLLSGVGIPAACIGYTTSDNIKGVFCHGGLTYLTPDGI